MPSHPKDNITIADSSSTTSLTSREYGHTWKINNILACKPPIRVKLQSRAFYIGKNHNRCIAVLDIFEFKKSDTMGNTLNKVGMTWNLYLHFKSSRPEKQEFGLTISTLSPTGVKNVVETVPHLSFVSAGVHKRCGGRKCFFGASNGLPSSRDLTMVFDFTEIRKLTSISPSTCKVLSPFNVKQQITKDFGELYQTGKYADFVIQCPGKEFKVHKFILALRSSVFSAMLDSNMAEVQRNRVIVEDIDPESMDAILTWAYTGEVDMIASKASHFLPIVDKYDFKTLKALCEETLICELSAENAFDLLELARVYSASKLKNFAFEYIRRNFNALKHSEGFVKSLTASPELVAEIFRIENFDRDVRGVKRKATSEEKEVKRKLKEEDVFMDCSSE